MPRRTPLGVPKLGIDNENAAACSRNRILAPHRVVLGGCVDGLGVRGRIDGLGVHLVQAGAEEDLGDGRCAGVCVEVEQLFERGPAGRARLRLGRGPSAIRSSSRT